MARSRRLVWIKSVLRAVPIYAMMAENLPPWARKKLDAICRNFFWAGTDQSIRGKCMVAWATCCRPTQLGGWEPAPSNWPGMPFRLAGYGCSERIRITHGVNCLSKRQRKCKPSSRLRLTRGLETADKPCSKRIGGSTSRTSQPSHHICTKQFHLECVVGKLSERDCTIGLGCGA
jgi:hypothetical protein